MWYSEHVRLFSIFRTLFCSLAVAGMLLAPLARSVMAMPATPSVGASGVMDVMSGGMSDDMPCSPDQAPASDCDKRCPLMALCSVASCQGLPSAIALNVVFRVTGVASPSNDPLVNGLATGPPRRPPKT